ncbi:MAG: FG-GAP repeat protein [Phycisphaerae bacterium]
MAAPANEEGACDDEDNCTTGDACANGVCLGTPVDCSSLDLGCLKSECSPETGVCELQQDPFDCDSNGLPDLCEILTFPNRQKLAAGVAGDSFGIVAIDGDTAVIGAPRDDDRRGSAYVYRLIDGTWQQTKKLTADNPSTNDYFGSSVAIGGNTIIVGTPSGSGAVQDSGVAYVFREEGGDWVQIAKLEGNDANEDDGFGTSVAIDGDTVLIGAIYDRDLVPVGGSAYIFREVGGVWQEIAKLTPDDGVVAELFGFGVALDGNTAVVGAQFGKTMDSTETGSVYIFREIGGAWQQMTELLADDGMAFDLFGFGLGIDGDFVLVGSPYSGIGGAAYLFEESAGNWQQIRKFTPPDPDSSDDFGTYVAIQGNLLAVGAPGDNENGAGSGAAYLTRQFGGDWIPLQKLTAADGASDDNLGTTVAITNAHLLAGAIGDYNGRGSVYAFELQDLDCNMNDVLDKCDIESGLEADCNLNGIPDVCELFGENSQDCSHLDDQCVIGICSLENATCSTIPANDGGSCDDLDACSPVDVCVAGTCVGMRTDCSSNALPSECPSRLYVDDSATNGLNDGSSWANAYVHLQDALAQAEHYCGISEIWVAAGTYRPDEGAMQTPGDRMATFQLISGLAIYGGFAGTESTLEDRDIDTNGTILSGDLLGNDVFVECEDTDPDCDAVGGFCRLGRCLFGTPFEDNAISVVNGSGTESTAILDGFVIADGSASGQAGAEYAGGITIENWRTMISNCEFRNNVSYFYGGAILSDNASPARSQIASSSNYCGRIDGAIYIRNGSARSSWIRSSRETVTPLSPVRSSNPTIIGCSFGEPRSTNPAAGFIF